MTELTALQIIIDTFMAEKHLFGPSYLIYFCLIYLSLITYFFDLN